MHSKISICISSVLIIWINIIDLDAQSTTIPVDLSRYELIGNVKYVRGYKFRVKHDGTKGEEIPEGYGYTPYMEFDSDGLLIKAQRYLSNGDTLLTVTYKYDDYNRPIRKTTETSTWWDENWEMYYDDENNEQYTLMYRNGKLLLTIKSEFSNDNYKLRSYNINKSDSIISERRYEYDSLGYLIKEMALYGNGDLIDERVYDYDARGNKIHYSRYVGTTNRRLTETVSYEYDEYSNLTRSVGQFSNLSNTIEHRYEYDYDHVGNWIRKYWYANGKPNEIIKREIKYF